MIHETMVLQTIAEKLGSKYDQGITKDMYTSLMRDVMMPVPSTIINRKEYTYIESYKESVGSILLAHPNCHMMSVRQCSPMVTVEVPEDCSECAELFMAGYIVAKRDQMISGLVADIQSTHKFDRVIILMHNDGGDKVSSIRSENYKTMMRSKGIDMNKINLRFMSYEHDYLEELRDLMYSDPFDQTRWLVIFPDFEDFRDSAYNISNMRRGRHLFVEYSFVPVNGSYNELLALTYEPIKNKENKNEN